MHRMAATTDELRQMVEAQYGGVATPHYVVPVRHVAGNMLWEGFVHVFRLSDTTTQAFAWTCPFDGRIHAVRQTQDIAGPADAVRWALQVRDQGAALTLDKAS
jgi:hypothetical protein